MTVLARFTISASLAFAAVPAAAGPWQFSVTPYLMLPSTSGTAAVGPAQVDVSTSPSDLFKNLNWGVMGIVEAHNGVWGVNLDATYANVDVNAPHERGSITGHQGVYAATVLYRVAPVLDLYAGVRVNSIGIHLKEFDNGGGPITGSRTRTWADPLVGARAVIPLGGRFDLTALADIGGFGAGSEIAAQVWPSIGWRVGRTTKVMAGYRVIYTDYRSGTGDKRFVYDITTFGPTLGLNIAF